MKVKVYIYGDAVYYSCQLKNFPNTHDVTHLVRGNFWKRFNCVAVYINFKIPIPRYTVEGVKSLFFAYLRGIFKFTFTLCAHDKTIVKSY